MLVASISPSLTARSAAFRLPRAQAAAIGGGLRGEAVFGDQPVVPRKEPRIEGLAGTQRIKCLLTVIANSGRQDGGHGHLVWPSPSPQRPHLNLRALIREAEAMLPFAMAITVGLPEIAATY